MRNRRARKGVAWCVVAAMLLCFSPGRISAQEVSDEQVEETIESMKRFLYSIQHEDGTWGDKTEWSRTGRTALVTLSLLMAGESAQTPQLQKSVAWLEAVNWNDRDVYDTSLGIHVFAQLPERYAGILRNATESLEGIAGAHRDGLFRYTRRHRNPSDISCQQFGILGLWEASKRGQAVSREVIQRHVDEVLRRQQADGGWGYQSKLAPCASMTCAGVTMLYIAQEMLHRTDRHADPAITTAIARGMSWMDKNFDPARNVGYVVVGESAYYYYLYSVERVGLAGGVSHIGAIDWYGALADRIVRRARTSGRVSLRGRQSWGEDIDTAFALMFLARGRYPVMIRKLQVPGMRCNERPNDVAFFVRYLSDAREAEMNWQLTSIDRGAYEWSRSPILYLTSEDAIVLDEWQVRRLRAYIDLGGTLVLSPENGSKEFSESAAALAARLYPQYPLRNLRGDDPIFEVGDPGRAEVLPDALVVSNGARNLIYIATGDWGYEFQAGNPEGHRMPWTIMTSIWASATNRGGISGRLTMHLEPRQHRDSTGEVEVLRVQHGGGWDPEPRAWEMVSNGIWNRFGVHQAVRAVEAKDLGAEKVPLAHLAGIDAYEFTGEELAGIETYIRNGGTLLVETVGGVGDFSRAAMEQLSRRLGVGSGPLPASHPVVTGRDLTGGYDNTTAEYRRYAVLKLGFKEPTFWSLSVGGRVAVVVSHQDLSLGALGARHWHVLGYETRSARHLLTNFVLWANRGAIGE